MAAIFEHPVTYLHIPPTIVLYKEAYKNKRTILIQRDANKWPGMEHFHMPSQRLCWCSKTKKTAVILVYQTNPSGIELYFLLFQ